MAITPTLVCGFECRISDASGGSHWNTLPAGASFDTTTKRNGATALRVNKTAGTANVFTKTYTAAAVVVGRFAVFFTSLPSADTRIAFVGSIGGEVFFQQSSGKLFASANNGANLGATGVVVTTGQWYVIDVRSDQTNNPILTDVQVNGTACGQSSWATAASNTTQSLIGLLNTCTCDMYFDDFMLSTTTGDYPIGDGYVNHFVPTSDGTHTATSTHIVKGTAAVPVGAAITSATTDAFNWVNGVPLLGGATDNTRLINQQTLLATEYAEVVFGPAPGISTPTVAPRGVEVITADQQASTASGGFSTKLNDNGTESVIITRSAAGVVTDRFVTKQYATAPTGGAWVIGGGGNGDFTNLRARFGYSGDATPDQYWRGIMIEAEFAAVVAAAGPFKDNDYQNPVGWQPHSRWLQVFSGWIKGTQVSLGVPERPPPGLAEGTRQTDWPNPVGLGPSFRAPAVIRDGWVWTTNLALGVPVAAVQAPFNQDDQPNPVLPRWSSAYLGWNQATQLTLGVPPTGPQLPLAYGQENDQPNPFRPDYRSTQGYVQSSNPAILQPPFGRLDEFPNPVLSKAHVAYAGWVQSGRALGIPPEPIILGSLHNYDFPNPIPPRYQYTGHQQPTNLSLLTAAPIPVPSYDWPNPLRSTFHIAYQGWSNPPTYFPPPNAMPFDRGATDDQPNPIGRDWRVAYQGFVQPNRTLGIPTGTPFGQDDWPNPIPRDFRVAYQGWVHSDRTLGIAAQPPFHQTDFPNPVGWHIAFRWPAVIRGGYTKSPGITLLPPPVAVVMPFRQLDWPNPVRRSWVAFVPPIQPQSHPSTTITTVPSARIRAEQTEFPITAYSRTDCAIAQDLTVQFAWQTYTGSSTFSSGVRTTQSVGEGIIAATSVNGRVTQTVVEVVTHS